MQMSPALRNQQRLIQLFDEANPALVLYVNEDDCLAVYEPSRIVEASFNLMEPIILTISIAERPGHPLINETLVPVPIDATDDQLISIVNVVLNQFKKY